MAAQIVELSLRLKIDTPAVLFPVPVAGRIRTFPATDFAWRLLVAVMLLGTGRLAAGVFFRAWRIGFIGLIVHTRSMPD